ncbi:hypothetical protein KPL71_026342 [Citrus sinensis]|uniref:Uncharacterized protein n=1 Tax=Citrus sinensis TaxID=2711 RepID=A0ACB8HYS5_CITSI|nr:hypothetical protein KPL71_026342 [Citrus sinensis]
MFTCCTSGTKWESNVELIIAVCWAIWYSRNCFIFYGKEENPFISVARAAAIVESVKRVKISKDQTISRHGQISQQTWTAPPNGCFKVNVDAAVKVSEQKAGLGVVIRNSRGRVVAVAVQNVACVPMVIESDSKEVVDLSLNRKESKTEIEWIIAEIQTKLRIQSQASIQFAPRGCNIAAHYVAKKALEVENQFLAIRGLNLAKEGDYAVLLDNKLGQTKFDGVVALLVLIVVQNLDKLGNIERNKIRCFAIAPTKCMSLNLAVRYEWIVNDCERKGKTEEKEKAMVLP